MVSRELGTDEEFPRLVGVKLPEGGGGVLEPPGVDDSSMSVALSVMTGLADAVIVSIESPDDVDVVVVVESPQFSASGGNATSL